MDSGLIVLVIAVLVLIAMWWLGALFATRRQGSVDAGTHADELNEIDDDDDKYDDEYDDEYDEYVLDLRIGQAVKWLALAVLVLGLLLAVVYVVSAIVNGANRAGNAIVLAQLLIGASIAVGTLVTAGVLGGIGAIVTSGVRREHLMRGEQ
jgi:hypothetical protein